MKERPILFSTAMVQAILNGTKTQTRRPTRLIPNNKTVFAGKIGGIPALGNYLLFEKTKWGEEDYEIQKNFEFCRYGNPGDVLWVKETWAKQKEYPNELPIFKSTISEDGDQLRRALKVQWKPSIHMPKDAARIWLEVTDVRVQRLQGISEQDAREEGVLIHEKGTHWLNYIDQASKLTQFIYNLNSAYESFRTLWDSINAKKAKEKNLPIAWKDNPYVWAVSFKVLSTSGKPSHLQ